MSDYYEKWLQAEKNWIDEAEKKYKKGIHRYSLLGVIGCIVVLGAIGLLSGSGVKGMLQNMGIGLLFGMILVFFMLILMKASLPAKRYMKNLKREIEDVLSEKEREEFARQMLETEHVKRISWRNQEEKTDENVYIARDYALWTSERGLAVMVQLQKVKNIVSDIEEYTITGRGGGFRLQHTVTVYLMRFYYQTPVEGKEKECDKRFVFSKRETREEVAYYFREMKVGEQKEG